jgi:hypothetical protein
MKTLAFRAFVGYDIIGIHTYGLVPRGGIDTGAIEQGKTALYGSAVFDGPFHATFINSVVGTFRLTGTTIDTFIRYFNSHTFLIIGLMKGLLLQDKINGKE